MSRLEPSRPRWVWDDTARWYPELLAAGVRVDRCVDLRLCHAILRASALTADSALATAPSNSWDAATPTPTPAPAAAGAPGGGPPGAPAPGGSILAARIPHTTLFDDLDAPQPERPAHPIADFDAPGESRTSRSPQLDAGGTREVQEFRAQREAARSATDPSRIALLLAAESAGALAAAEMQHAGLPWSRDHHDALLTELLGPRPTAPGALPPKLDELRAAIRHHLNDPTANPDSPVELLKSLRRAGIAATSTRSWELENIVHPAIPPLLDYKKRSRLLTANGWNWLDTWVQDGRFHPHYLPGGVVTGRWAAEGGGALQLPKQVRGAVRADEGWLLVVADAAQLEPRILAALAGDRAMAAAGRGRDLYDGIVASGAVDTRAHAKLGMLGAMYGGTTGESGRMLPRLARAYPAAIAFVEDAARAGEAGARVSTRLGRTSPRPSDDWLDLRDEAASDAGTEAVRARARSAARSWGRFTRNFVVQGTAAEWALCWLAGIRRRLWALPPAHSDAHPGAHPDTHRGTHPDARLEHRPHLAFFLHDEVMVHTPAAQADAVAAALRESAAEAGRLNFGEAPVEFPVTVAVVDRYDRAK
ncbi:MAG: bifunctional 3'-5' exonuclease/DNA polymerase [Herbiconiux sp.]|nr:bifunctional 3'-5' exonuclease/DNA polymerase [Herbiconiux sp.]